MTDRGRVPFALIGVLLLVSSGAVVVSDEGPVAAEPAVDEALDGLAAESQTALRSAVREAARNAAREPVLVSANSSVGRHFDDARPFRDSLRLRIYLQARDHLRRLGGRRRGFAVSAALPAIRDPSDVRRAIERVRLRPVGSTATRLRVTIDGLALRASRDGRVLGSASRQPTVVVRTPVLHVHRRVQAFEAQLNAGLARDGLARRLTAVLYPVAWARGYAQFGGQPVENVVANAHLELLTNEAVLHLQRRQFGRADPLGRRVYARSLAETAVTELVSVANSSALRRLQRLRTRTGHAESTGDTLERLEPDGSAPGPSDELTVDVGRTADLAYVRALGDLEETLDRTYRPAVRVRADVSRLERRTHRDGTRRGARLGSRTTTRTAVRNRSGLASSPADGWHALWHHSRTVTITRRTVTFWALGDNLTSTSSRTVRTTYAVDLLVEGDHAVGPAPPGAIEGVHEPGGPFDGPNLADVRALAREHVAARGGVDALARRAATGDLDSSQHRLQADRPDDLAAWSRPDLTRLRHRVRNVSVTVSRGRVATFEANVARRLADRLRVQWADLVDAPDRYGSVARRARVGVRADYVDRVLARLDEAARGYERGRAGLADALPETARSPAALLAEGRTARLSESDRPRPTVPMRVDATPSYLTLAAVDAESVPGLPPGRTEHPLVARNLNAFSVPTDDVVEVLFGLLSGPERTSVRSAVAVLRASERVPTVAVGRPTPADELRDGLGRTVEGYERAARATLARQGLGTDVGRRKAVTAALERWDGPVARAEAIVNGSAGEAVLAAAVDRWPHRLNDTADRAVLEIDLATAAHLTRSRSTYKPEARLVNETASRVRTALDVAVDRARAKAKAVAKRKAAAIAASLPSGVPVLPAPGLWYATVNAWHVQVRGSYARFAVSVPRGAPHRLPADLRYVRENATVRLDVDGDGTRETLGRNRRVGFEAETAVAIAVPPRPRGVGDVGETDERSAGWPTPGRTDSDERK